MSSEALVTETVYDEMTNSDSKANLKKAFYEIIEDIATHPDVLAMKKIKHHTPENNRYEHSMYVAYISFLICHKLGLDARAAARGALLHDFEFLSEIPNRPHPVKLLFTHPKNAVKQACSIFDLSKKERDIVKKHMWPMTVLSIPRYKESMIVSCVDKYCATIEMAGYFEKTKSARVIEAFA